MPNLKILILLTIVLVLTQIFWIISDPRPIGEKFSKTIAKTYIVVGLISLGQIISGFYFAFPKTPFDNYIQITGAALTILGAVFATWAKFIMGKFWGPPAEHEFKRQTRLITTGPFSFSRNPIYLGIIFMVLGFSLALRSFAIFLVILLCLYFYSAILEEEKLLEKFFGQNYLNYKAKVPRFLKFKLF